MSVLSTVMGRELTNPKVMTSLLPQGEVKLTSGKFQCAEISLPAQTDAIEVRIKRPTTANPLNWDANGRVRVTIAVTIDGTEHKCVGGTSGGIRTDRAGQEIPEYILRYTPTWGRFGGETNKRLGETGSVYTARVEVEWLAGSVETEVVVRASESPAPGAATPLTGLVFPRNDDDVGSVQFRFTGANLPNIVPVTVLWKYYPIQQTGYHTTFFFGRGDGSFVATPTYFGCHPYPQGGAGGTTQNWEISCEGQDRIIDENGNNTTVIKDAWYSQAASSRSGGANTLVDFYWNLAVSTNRLIRYQSFDPLTNDANSPCLVFGDAPWSPTNENLSGILRGTQLYTAQLSEAHMAALGALETDAAVLAYCTANNIASLWYLNMNPTPTDISDKSGAGHSPTWFNANRPTLWVG